MRMHVRSSLMEMGLGAFKSWMNFWTAFNLLEGRDFIPIVVERFEGVGFEHIFEVYKGNGNVRNWGHR